MLDLVLPLACGGCGALSTRWCEACAGAFLAEPVVVTTRVDPGVPVLSLGRYAAVRRQAIVTMKDRGRRDLSVPLGLALTRGVDQLLRWRLIERPVTLVPAPTRWTSARARGGDPVTAVAGIATRIPGVHVASLLRMKLGARDSVGLSVSARQRNVAGRIAVRRGPRPDTELVLVDDVVTTGATAAESVRVLRTAGFRVAAVLTLTYS
ncbi:ComF family protein [Mycobacterium sp. CBMA271]|uniref:ComF family protein n=1 Tax=unclassified Mycobacteroides TaxID=2618759 RepID=UPI0012DE6950|nr:MULTISPECIES: ComF family protein [unclassified Mycobacteroides]MUM16485.1 phosphoribosyltransferase [Mycobacteroides sp. CBMA 326]MUM20570.1 ComF family protein [Mycobacteroides sp. CBMA 271]